jgi:glycosyltransferase involved in cell wall biosynthesis
LPEQRTGRPRHVFVTSGRSCTEGFTRAWRRPDPSLRRDAPKYFIILNLFFFIIYFPYCPHFCSLNPLEQTMNNHSINKIAFLGSYVPRQCGIATFTYDLFRGFQNLFPSTHCSVVTVSDTPGSYGYPEEVRFEIDEKSTLSYHHAAEFINFNEFDIVCVQHEFGIYGGVSGSYLLKLLEEINVPVITTFHTILNEPDPTQFRIMEKITNLSSKIISMTSTGKHFLNTIYGFPEKKIEIIPHGIPDMAFVDPNFYKDELGVEGKTVLLTFGLLAPNKGIELAIRALPPVLDKFPNIVYVILGATHPVLLQREGEAYRMSLEQLVVNCGVERNVIFHNKYVDYEQLKRFIGAADIYLTPYLNKEQITSGTLSYCFGSGKAVVSTPYWHAQELLGDGRGVIVPFNSSPAIAEAVIGLLSDDIRRNAIRKNAFLMGREMVWKSVAQKYMKCFEEARDDGGSAAQKRRFSLRTFAQQKFHLPEFRFDHLINLTDSSGIFQHAKYTVPDLVHGYCTDDNARALLLTVLLEELGIKRKEIDNLAIRSLAFLNYALDHDSGRFKNFMSFSRDWLENEGSEDSHGRAVWALCACVGRTKRSGFEKLATQLLDISIHSVQSFTSPRSWAFVLIGIHQYLKRFSGDTKFISLRNELAQRLYNTFLENSTSDWPWCEQIVSYSNAKLPQALIVSGNDMGKNELVETGLKSLRWLMEIQLEPQGYFRPVGCNGFFVRGKERAQFDQQPIEAFATVSSCIEAYRVSSDEYWLKAAQLVFEWFIGRNDLGIPVYDHETGGCKDALHVDRVNQNEGAESTLAYLLSLTEMHLLGHIII